MKKAWTIFLLIMLLSSCTKNDKKALYDKQLSNLLNNEYVLSNNKPFDVSTNIKLNNEKNIVEIMFFNPQFDMHDLTIMLLDMRVTEAKDAPLNVGFFSDSINFVSQKTDVNDQTRIRFTFYSDINNPIYKCALSYLDSNSRIESYYKINVK